MSDSNLNEMIDLTGQVAIVTGGGRGIGRAIARALAQAGATSEPKLVVIRDIK